MVCWSALRYSQFDSIEHFVPRLVVFVALIGSATLTYLGLAWPFAAMKSVKYMELHLTVPAPESGKTGNFRVNGIGIDHPRFFELFTRRAIPRHEYDPRLRSRPEAIYRISAQAAKNKLEDVTREDIVDFLSNLYKEKMDSRSVARYLVSLRGLYKFAMMESTVTTDPTENLESPKIRNSLPTYLRVEEINKLLEAPNLSTPHRT